MGVGYLQETMVILLMGMENHQEGGANLLGGGGRPPGKGGPLSGKGLLRGGKGGNLVGGASVLFGFPWSSSPWNPWYPLWYPPLTPTGSFIKKIIVVPNLFYWDYHNPSLGFATNARACKVAGQEGSLGVRLHALGSARECEGIDSHTPKGTPTLGFGVPVDSLMFREQL